MVTLGVDAHKRSHTVVAADPNGKRLSQITVKATPAGHVRALEWAQELDVERRWAVEDCRHLSRRMQADLLRAGETVVCVPPKLMAGARRGGRRPGKSDPIDAEAVARAALRESDLPEARLDGPERGLRLLVDHREDLVAERTRIQNRLHWHLLELFPGWELPTGALDRLKWLSRIEERLEAVEGIVAEIARELVDRCRELTRAASCLERKIASQVQELAPALLAIVGCGPLTAAKIVGETAGVDRFRSKDAYAMHNGTAPIPVWSGNTERHRLNRGGNRQLNCAIHRIAVTQKRMHTPAQEFLDRKMTAGKTKTEALRSLKRQLSNVVYRTLREDQRDRLGKTCAPRAA